MRAPALERPDPGHLRVSAWRLGQCRETRQGPVCPQKDAQIHGAEGQNEVEKDAESTAKKNGRKQARQCKERESSKDQGPLGSACKGKRAGS